MVKSHVMGKFSFVSVLCLLSECVYGRPTKLTFDADLS